MSIALGSNLMLSGCSWFSANDGREDIDDSYLNSKQGKELQIPANADEIIQNDNFQIPEGAVIVNRQAKGNLLNLEPPQLLLTSGDGVREDTDASYPTVWLRAQSSELKSLLDGFVEANNLNVESVSNDALVTDWLSDEEEGLGEGLGSYNIDDQRHKFSLNLIAENANEFAIQAIHLTSQQEIDGSWKDVSTSNRVARQFLNQFIGYYDGVRNRQARARILAEGIIETRLGTNSRGSIAIVSDRDFQAIWQQTPAVLESLNLPIIDRDQSQGLFFFKVAENSGFWNSLFGKNTDSRVDMLPGNYRILVETLANGGSSISFQDEEGQKLSPNLVGKIYPEFKAAFRKKEL